MRKIVKVIVASTKKELDVMEAFGKNCRRIRRSSQRDGRTFRKVTKCRCSFVAGEFGHDDPEMEGLYISGSTAAPVRLMHADQHGYSILCFDAENSYFRAEEDEEVYCWPPKEWVMRYQARGG